MRFKKITASLRWLLLPAAFLAFPAAAQDTNGPGTNVFAGTFSFIHALGTNAPGASGWRTNAPGNAPAASTNAPALNMAGNPLLYVITDTNGHVVFPTNFSVSGGGLGFTPLTPLQTTNAILALASTNGGLSGAGTYFAIVTPSAAQINWLTPAQVSNTPTIFGPWKGADYVQQAVNSLPFFPGDLTKCGGGEILVYGQNFCPGLNLTNGPTSINSYRFVGAAYNSSALISTNLPAIYVNNGAAGIPTIYLSLRDVTISSTLNTASYLIDEENGVCHNEFLHCKFGYWGYLTNNIIFSTPVGIADSSTYNSLSSMVNNLAIRVYSLDGEKGSYVNNRFTGIVGIFCGDDHAQWDNNLFGACGNRNTGWSTSSPFWTGACYVLWYPTHENVFYHNDFYDVTAMYFVNGNAGPLRNGCAVISFYDKYETSTWSVLHTGLVMEQVDPMDVIASPSTHSGTVSGTTITDDGSPTGIIYTSDIGSGGGTTYTYYTNTVGSANNSLTVKTNGSAFDLSVNWSSIPGLTYSITVTTNPAAAGTVTGAGIYAANFPTSLVATAASGYGFAGWSGWTNSTAASILVQAATNLSLLATFTNVTGAGAGPGYNANALAIWPLTNSLLDISGNSQTLTLTKGSSVFTNGGFYLATGMLTSPALNFTSTNRTVSFWYNRSTQGVAASPGVGEVLAGGPSWSIWGWDAISEFPDAQLHEGASVNTAMAVVVTNTWVNYILVQGPSGTALYVNGVLVSGHNLSMGSTISAIKFFIGPNDSGYVAYSSLAWLEVYDRVLTSAEITTVAHGGTLPGP